MNRTLAEVLAELFMIIDSVILNQDTDGLQLTIQRPLGSSRLRDICAVQIVHAICSDDSSLFSSHINPTGWHVDAMKVPAGC